MFTLQTVPSSAAHRWRDALRVAAPALKVRVFVAYIPNVDWRGLVAVLRLEKGQVWLPLPEEPTQDLVWEAALALAAEAMVHGGLP